MCSERNGWIEDMCTVRHCVINKIQMIAKSPKPPEENEQEGKEEKKRNDFILNNNRQCFASLSFSTFDAKKCVRVLVLWSKSSDIKCKKKEPKIPKIQVHIFQWCTVLEL